MSGRIIRDGQQRGPAIPVIGKLKVGIKHEQKGYPMSLDYFRATGKYADLFTDQFGDKPQSIPIVFISDNAGDVCVEQYVLRDKAGKKYAYGDGHTFYVSTGKEYGEFGIDEYPDIMERCAEKTGTEWEEVLTLRFLIPQIRGVIGQWQLDTKAKRSSIGQITGAYDFIQQQVGSVLGFPFDLQVEKVTSQKPGDKSTFPVIRLVPNMGVKHIEMLREYLSDGNDVRRLGAMITAEALESASPKALGPAKPPAVVEDVDEDWGEPNDELFG